MMQLLVSDQTVISTDTITSCNKFGTDDILITLSVTNENAALLISDLLRITGKILDGEGAMGFDYRLINDSRYPYNAGQFQINYR